MKGKMMTRMSTKIRESCSLSKVTTMSMKNQEGLVSKPCNDQSHYQTANTYKSTTLSLEVNHLTSPAFALHTRTNFSMNTDFFKKNQSPYELDHNLIA
jgi:hypothetical protein